MAGPPFAPFGGDPDGDGEPLTTTLPDSLGLRSLWYQALAPQGLFPPVIDEMELWQVGVALGGDVPRGPRPPMLVIPQDDNADPSQGPVLASADWFD